MNIVCESDITNVGSYESLLDIERQATISLVFCLILFGLGLEHRWERVLDPVRFSHVSTNVGWTNK